MPIIRNNFKLGLITLLACLFILPIQTNAAAPHVLATLKPLHSLVSALMLNVSQPELLLDNLQSPHDYNMKPSDRRRLNRADIIIYASADIESFIPAIENTLRHQHVINLSKIPGVHLLPGRKLDSTSHRHDHHTDGHIWLSIDNAIVISQHLTTELIKQDASNSKIYHANSVVLIEKLRQLQQHIKNKLQTFSDQPFLMFHDAFQYFENEFGLNAGLFVTTSAEHKAGIRHISSLKQQLQQQDIRCVFYEPPHIPKIVQTITVENKHQLVPLEPLGIQFQAGPEQYFELLGNISNKLYTCLKQDL